MIVKTTFMKIPFNETFMWNNSQFTKQSKLKALCKESRRDFIFSGHERVSYEIKDDVEDKEDVWNFYLQNAAASNSNNNIYSTTTIDDDDDDLIFP